MRRIALVSSLCLAVAGTAKGEDGGMWWCVRYGDALAWVWER